MKDINILITENGFGELSAEINPLSEATIMLNPKNKNNNTYEIFCKSQWKGICSFSIYQN